jgi:zinc D-Ala-D-Ala carboxypeptidase
LRNSRPAGRAKSAAEPSDDIPIAQRDRFTPAVTTMTGLRRQRNHLARGMFVASAIAITSLLLALGLFFSRSADTKTASSTTPPAATTPVDDVVLGHFRYVEAPSNALVSIGGELKLRAPAALKFKAMVSAARAAGVNITTISAFRSVSEQKRLFFDVKAERAQVTTKRAEVSAPPHYSEHHTGYAVDLGDATVSSANLNQGFENTPAFKWLQANAPRYSFELSFPKGNAQGVSYEPWHWRYVGDSDSLETFYKAHQKQSGK